jgi:hypothetical protein
MLGDGPQEALWPGHLPPLLGGDRRAVPKGWAGLGQELYFEAAQEKPNAALDSIARPNSLLVS